MCFLILRFFLSPLSFYFYFIWPIFLLISGYVIGHFPSVFVFSLAVWSSGGRHCEQTSCCFIAEGQSYSSSVTARFTHLIIYEVNKGCWKWLFIHLHFRDLGGGKDKAHFFFCVSDVYHSLQRPQEFLLLLVLFTFTVSFCLFRTLSFFFSPSQCLCEQKALYLRRGCFFSAVLT